MARNNSINALNRLFQGHHRSLVTYLADACPWTHSGDEKASDTLAHILADQQTLAGRIAELIDARGGRVDPGSFPMYFTEFNLLSLDFMVGELLHYQDEMIASIEQIVAALGADREARELAEETLGAARAHREALSELTMARQSA